MAQSVPSCSPGWVPDGEVSSCILCDVPFTLLRRRHHCRKCGNVVCSSCSPHRVPLPLITGSKAPTRVCTPCMDDIEALEDEQEAMKEKLRRESMSLAAKLQQEQLEIQPAIGVRPDDSKNTQEDESKSEAKEEEGKNMENIVSFLPGIPSVSSLSGPSSSSARHSASAAKQSLVGQNSKRKQENRLTRMRREREARQASEPGAMFYRTMMLIMMVYACRAFFRRFI